MGRRPNALIGQYFRRGQKLEDSSNRYQQTCNKCGEHFAKGRIDSMQTHLLRRCPGLTREDRAHIFNEMQRNPGSARRPQHHKSDGVHSRSDIGEQTHQFPLQDGPRQHNVDPIFVQPSDGQVRSSTQLPFQEIAQDSFPPQRQESALDTLAEVSRHHLDLSAQRSSSFGEAQEALFMRESERALIEHTLMAAFQRQPHANSAMPQVASSSQHFEEHTTTHSHDLTTTESMISLPLMQTATAANQQLEQSESMAGTRAASTPRNDDGLPGENSLHAHAAARTLQADFPTWTSMPQQPLTQHQDPPSIDPLPEFSHASTANRAVGRARFTEDRRKKVEEVRKLGACIRCRMLKKPCSDGTPCDRCQKVKVARLWNFGCLRTRLADELQLFSTGFFRVGSARQLEAVQTMSWEKMSEIVEVNFFSEASMAMALKSKRYSPASGTSSPLFDNAGTVLLLSDDLELPEMLTQYCAHDSTLDTAQAHESSHFLRTTLHEARHMLRSEVAPEVAHATKPNHNHIEPSALLRQVLELWVQCALLARSNSIDNIMLRLTTSNADSKHVLKQVDWSGSESMLPITGVSHNLIKAQLLTALEGRVHRLSKSILNELERHLLQRQQVSAFATFIATVIFLSCVERMTAFYHNLEQSLQSPASSLSHWPLEMPPSAICAQAAQFVSLLDMLLRMRALPPKTTRTDRGTLAVLEDHDMRVKRNGPFTREQVDEDARKAAEWLDPMELDVAWLIERRDGVPSTNGDGDEAWKQCDMRFISVVLLGEST